MNSENWDLAWRIVPVELWHTIYMVVMSTFFAVLIGLPLGIVLTLTGKGHLRANRTVHQVLETIVNIGRSFPFAILIIALIPVTRLIVGTSLGTTASIVPLTIAAIPLFARSVEIALNDIDRQIVETVVVMGSSTTQIITKVLLPEAWPSIILGITSLVISLIGYSTLAGLVGGGGLGQVAIQYGYNLFNGFIMTLTVVLLICLVQLVQWFGRVLHQQIQKKRGKWIHD